MKTGLPATLLALFLLILVGGCGGDPALRPDGRGPAMWRVEKAGLSAHVFGTIHVLPPDTPWQTPKMRAALEGADRLVLEAANLDDAAALQDSFSRMGQSPGLPPVADRVPAADRAALRTIMARGDISADSLTPYESWAAAMLLSTAIQGDIGLSGAQGVEPVLIQGFRSLGRPVDGLETAEAQFALFDRLPEDAQRRFLSDTIAQAKDARTAYDRMLRSWLAGDMDAIARDFAAEVAPEPALAQPLLTDRNRAWAARITAMTGRPFIAVGAAHLAGPGNLLDLLRADGFRVTRVQ
ncbi:MAG: TraB/GumN family protein [Sphingobium sp.]|nr:MAG: TraB/GumN family protein [Sphingobium sp.]